MSYVIFHRATSRLIQNDREYPTERGAKIALARACKRDGLYPLDYGIMDADQYYSNEEKQVERVNLMTGEKYRESVNTPPHLSPAFESYWSM